MIDRLISWLTAHLYKTASTLADRPSNLQLIQQQKKMVHCSEEEVTQGQARCA